MLILMGTDHKTYDEMRNKHFTPIVWASNDLQTVAHYYSGCIVELDIGIDPNQRLPFVSNMEELEQVLKDNHKRNIHMVKSGCNIQ